MSNILKKKKIINKYRADGAQFNEYYLWHFSAPNSPDGCGVLLKTSKVKYFNTDDCTKLKWFACNFYKK